MLLCYSHISDINTNQILPPYICSFFAEPSPKVQTSIWFSTIGKIRGVGGYLFRFPSLKNYITQRSTFSIPYNCIMGTFKERPIHFYTTNEKNGRVSMSLIGLKWYLIRSSSSSEWVNCVWKQAFKHTRFPAKSYTRTVYVNRCSFWCIFKHCWFTHQLFPRGRGKKCRQTASIFFRAVL